MVNASAPLSVRLDETTGAVRRIRYGLSSGSLTAQGSNRISITSPSGSPMKLIWLDIRIVPPFEGEVSQ